MRHYVYGISVESTLVPWPYIGLITALMVLENV